MKIENKVNLVLAEFSELYSKLTGVDKEKIVEMCKGTIKYYSKKSDVYPLKHLDENWFKGQEEGVNLYEVYGHEDYYAEVFACWYIYSRNYIKNIIKLGETNKPLFDSIGFSGVKSIIDLGNGLGLTSLTLARQFPNAKVFATNLKNTVQWEFCSNTNSNEYELIDDYSNIGSVDMVFASEYFEHVDNCLEHVRDVVEKLNPKILVIANSFNTRGIGHLYNYHNYGDKIPQEKISKIFQNLMYSMGYEKAKTGFWNNTPHVYVKKVVKPFKTNWKI
jgi:2-polyprenyl-3-methyl-5-hydroxy-6-metoxy-1,4-benzoquinol methylase